MQHDLVLATDALRALLHTLARHVPAADLIAVLDTEREWLASLTDKQSNNQRADTDERTQEA